jgi:hypothetical protein
MIEDFIDDGELSRDLITKELIIISEYIDYVAFNKIINKLTDYAEIMTEGKLSGIINFNFSLNSAQTNRVIEFMADMQIVSRIYTLALKGKRDLESEYISNIFTDTITSGNNSSYINLKTILENRITHQVQQYNTNMNKSNTSLSIPINELRGHVKTFSDMSENKITVSTKVQHGMIAASLHDAYTLIMNRADFNSDRTYMKFYFNEDDDKRRGQLIIRKEKRLSLREIKQNTDNILYKLTDISKLKSSFFEKTEKQKSASVQTKIFENQSVIQGFHRETFIDRMHKTPFGAHYGGVIDRILNEIFNKSRTENYNDDFEDGISRSIYDLYEIFKANGSIIEMEDEAVLISDYLIFQEYSTQTFAEKFIYIKRNESFNRFYTNDMRIKTEQFITILFSVYFDVKFRPLFRIIKSLDIRRFACVYIIKRIYMIMGDDLTKYAHFFIRVIAQTSGIRTI